MSRKTSLLYWKNTFDPVALLDILIANCPSTFFINISERLRKFYEPFSVVQGQQSGNKRLN
jgi:hypothetical protein